MAKVTVIDVVRYNVHRCSSQIREIKVAAINAGTYINPKLPSWNKYRGLKQEATRWLSRLRDAKYTSEISGCNFYYIDNISIKESIEKGKDYKHVALWRDERAREVAAALARKQEAQHA